MIQYDVLEQPNRLVGLSFIFSFLLEFSYFILYISCTEEYFNFVENQSIVVISYDKVGCQYLKIDNNLGVGEREGVN